MRRVMTTTSRKQLLRSAALLAAMAGALLVGGCGGFDGVELQGSMFDALGVSPSAIAQNKQGEPAEGLKKEDFTILDQGKEQKVATFSANSVAQRDSFPASILPRMYSPTESAKRDELREA